MKIYLLLFVLTLSCSNVFAQKRFSLEDAIRYGIEQSNAIKAKEIDVTFADQDIKEFKSIGLPKVNAGVDYSYYFAVPAQPVEDFISPSVYEVLFQENVLERRELGPPETFEFSFVQPHVLTGKIEANSLIFDGSYLYGLKATKLYKDLVRKELESSKQTIKGNITKAYMAVLITERNIGIIQQNIVVLEKSLSDTRAIYENGFAESLDVDRIALSLDNLNIRIDQLNQLRLTSLNLLKFQMGYPIEEDIVLEDDIETMLTDFDATAIRLQDEIDFSQRAEYQVIETGQALNELDLKRNKAGYLPSARAFVSLQESLQRRNLFDGNEAGWLPTAVAGVSLDIPIYDGGEKSAKIQKVKLNIEKAALEKEEFERGMTLQVRNARLALIQANKTLKNRENALRLSEDIYNKTKIKFTEGVGSSVEVMQAEASLYESQSQYINALYDLLQAKTDLNIALGEI